jgi:uncharacterized coiled-coil protein SlyX
MQYIPGLAQAQLDSEGVRRFTEDELRNIARVVAEGDQALAAGAASLTALTARVTALEARATADEALIATNAANIAANTSAIATNTAAIAAHTASLAKLTNNQFARVYLSTAQAGIAVSDYVVINFDTVAFDPAGIWNSSGKYFKPTIPGYYRLSWYATCTWGAATAQALVVLYRTGVGVLAYGNNLNAGSTFAGIGGTDIVHFDGTSERVDARAYLAGAASRDILGAPHFTYFTIELVKAD